MTSEIIEDYLKSTYDDIAEEQFNKIVNRKIDLYLKTLYKRIAEKEAR